MSLEEWFITSNIAFSLRSRAASVALAATVGLTAIKLWAAYYSHSVGVLSEGIHSFLDLVSASLSFFSVREAGKPADIDHPFGHGKIETLSSLFEALLLTVAAGLIIFEGIDHYRNPTPLQHQNVAVGVILFSLIVSYGVYRHNSHAARETESSAIHVNALHFFSDVIASIGVLVGLITIEFTGWTLLDPFIAWGIALYILFVSVKQVKIALRELSDRQLPEDELLAVRTALDEFKEKIIEAHEIRTRKSGATRHIDFHLVVCRYLTVEESHTLCDQIESRISNLFSMSSVNIHVEPCQHVRTQCYLQCPLSPSRKKP